VVYKDDSGGGERAVCGSSAIKCPAQSKPQAIGFDLRTLFVARVEHGVTVLFDCEACLCSLCQATDLSAGQPGRSFRARLAEYVSKNKSFDDVFLHSLWVTFYLSLP